MARMAITSQNPATGQILRTFDAHTSDHVREAIGAAHAAFANWRLTTFDERSSLMLAAADLLDDEKDTIAEIVTLEMGKPRKEARAEAGKCARAMRWYAERAHDFLADEPIDAGAVGAEQAYTRYQPMGVVLAVMPWNFPLWQVVRFAAPALMAGNVGLLKHASNVPQCSLYLQDLFARAGFPAGVFTSLLIGADEVEAALRDPRVRAATLTGSEAAGRSVAAVCGEEIKKTVLELGGSDPFVVMPSADVAQAAAVAVTARCQNNGQSCIAAKRFIVHADVYDQFAEALVEGMSALVMGDPLDESTQLGPLSMEQGRDDVERMVADARDKGATVLCGGNLVPGPGWFYEATVVADVTADMELYGAEVFGPVAVLYRVDSIDDAIELGNDTPYGLGASAWTADIGEQARFVRDLDAGVVTINAMTASYPEMPFGGTKRSGYGRELSDQGIREFCNAKAVWIG